jgi:hypothetical protein
MFIIPNESFASIATVAPKAKASLKRKLISAGRAFKSFFKDHAKMYRI